MSRQPITLEELLIQWRWRQLAFGYQLKHLEQQPQSVERTLKLQAVAAMKVQVEHCIADLEKILYGEYPVVDLLKMIVKDGND